MKEVKLKRVAGPYDHVPFDNFIQSPIGLVPKVGGDGKQMHLIFHLSYNFEEGDGEEAAMSLNHHTPQDICSVKYNDLDYAVRAYLKVRSQAMQQHKDEDDQVVVVYAGKSDVKSAFRLAPLKSQCWPWLIMSAEDPKTGKLKFFVDKCLPFGASISCAIFQEISNALKHLIECRTSNHINQSTRDTITNYLDDFLFLAVTIGRCNQIMEHFFVLCEEVGIPISFDKTEKAQICIVFLGIMLDGKQMLMRLPLEKREKAIKLIQNLMDKKKATVHELQELCGYLNFLCKAIFPGRPFIRRMYAKYSEKMQLKGYDKKNSWERKFALKPHHHICLDAEFKADCKVWLTFLNKDSDLNQIVNRPMIDVLAPSVTSEEICFYSDASSKIGYGCLFDTK